MTTPKNEDEILRDFEEMEMTIPDGELKGCLVYHEITKGMFRSALASYTMHLKRQMPERKELLMKDGKRIEWNYGKSTMRDIEKFVENGEAYGHNAAIYEVHTFLDEKIRKLTE